MFVVRKRLLHTCELLNHSVDISFVPATYRMNDVLGAGDKRSEENPPHLHGGNVLMVSGKRDEAR